MTPRRCQDTVLRASRCVVAVEVDAEEGPIACDEPAPYAAQKWGHGPGSDEIPCCEHHAAIAWSDGVEVLGPSGHPVREDDAGELYELSLSVRSAGP